MARKNESGYVYVLSNPSLNCVKIGHTKGRTQWRADQLSRFQAIPTPFKVEYSGYIENCFDIERYIHKKFSDRHVGKEFYEVDPKDVWDELKRLGAISEDDRIRLLQVQATKRIKKIQGNN